MRDIIFSACAGYAFADSFTMFLGTEAITRAVAGSDTQKLQNWLFTVQLTWVLAYAVICGFNVLMLKTVLQDSKPLWPYSPKTVAQFDIDREIQAARQTSYEVELEEKTMSERCRTRSTEDLEELVEGEYIEGEFLEEKL